MKKGLLTMIGLWLFASASAQLSGFTENRGQVIDTEGNAAEEVLYTAMSGNTAVFIMSDRIACVVKQEQEEPVSFHDKDSAKKIITSRFDIVLENGAAVAAGQQLPGYSNFYLAHCPQGITHVPSFSKVIYRNIYEKIDLVIGHNDNGLKLEFVVSKGGDPSLVKILFEGEKEYRLNTGNIVDVMAATGVFTFEVNVIPADGKAIALNNDNVQGSSAKTSLPVHTLTSSTWATYIGGSDSEEAPGLALDEAGDAYSAGYTQSINLPVGTGTVQDTLAGGYDAFVFKLDNATGNRAWATYYGGTGTDFGYKVKVHNYMPVLCGYGSSIDLPMSAGAWQPAAAGSYDGFIVKLNANGTLNRTTYYGGPNGELLLAMGMDKAGNVYTGGATGSMTGLPVTAGAFQTVHGGAMDAFCAKFDTSLSLVWATYYGGSGSEDMHAMTIDTSANVIFSGGTYSTNFPVSANAFQPASMGGGEAYIVKMDSGGARLWATYLGGYSNDDINGLAADEHNNIYAAGFTESLDFPVTGNAYQSSLAGASDAVIAKFSPSGNPSWITFYGGSLYDYGGAIDADTSGHLFVGGYTNSADLPVSSAAFQPNNAGSFDAFFLRFDTAQAFGWGTYFGGSYDEFVYALEVDTMWNVFIGGTTNSFNLPDTAGVMQPVAGGNGDGFMAKLDGSYGLTIGVAETSLNELKVYPNPSAGKVFIDLPEGAGGRLSIIDITGRTVKTIDIATGQRMEIGLEELVAGVYLLRWNDRQVAGRIVRIEN